jgi:hypothetical protein
MSGLEIAGLVASGIAGLGTAIQYYKNWKRRQKERLERKKMNDNIEMICKFFNVPIDEDKKNDNNDHEPVNPELEREIEIETPSEFEVKNVRYNKREGVLYIEDERYNKYSHNTLPN